MRELNLRRRIDSARGRIQGGLRGHTDGADNDGVRAEAYLRQEG